MSAPHEIIEIDRRRFATMLKDADGNLNKVSISALSNRRSADEFVQLITARRTRAVENIVAIGQYLREAKEELDHGEFGPMLKRIQFSEGTARKYMAIAAHPVISNRSNWNALPPSWTTLYQLTKLPHGIFQARIDDYTVTPEFEGAVVAALKAGSRSSRQRDSQKRITELQRENDLLRSEVEALRAELEDREASQTARHRWRPASLN